MQPLNKTRRPRAVMIAASFTVVIVGLTVLRIGPPTGPGLDDGRPAGVAGEARIAARLDAELSLRSDGHRAPV